MKTNIDSSEVKRILEMHSKLKKNRIVEQDVDNEVNPNLNNTTKKSEESAKVIQPELAQKEIDYKLLQDSETAGCLKNGKIRTLKGGQSYAYVAKTKSGLDVIFYPNMTYKFFESGKGGKWKCSKAEQIKSQTETNQKEINKIKQEGKWFEAKEISDTVQNLENPNMYEKKIVNGVTLYRSKASSGIAAGLTADQQKIIQKWKNQNAKLRNELDPEEAKTWSARVVSPASEGYFNQDLIMYFPPENVVGSNADKISNEFNKAVNNQTPTSKKDCRDTIRAYYEAWKTKKRIQPNTFEPMKEKVQACVNQFDGEWGGVLSKIDEYVQTLRGGSGGPLSYGEDAKWRLN